MTMYFISDLTLFSLPDCNMILCLAVILGRAKNGIAFVSLPKLSYVTNLTATPNTQR